MDSKYTIRDFLVYFITGLFLLLTLLYEFKYGLLTYFGIKGTDLKDYSAVIVFLLIPGLYLVGHIIHGVDLMTFKVGRYIWAAKTKYSHQFKKVKLFWLLNTANFIFNGNKISGILNQKNIKTSLFWKDCCVLQYQNKFDKAEYWMIMNDLFKGLSLVSLAWVCYYSCNFNKCHLIITSILTVIFWHRARHMAKNFVSTTKNLIKIVNQTTTSNKVEKQQPPLL